MSVIFRKGVLAEVRSALVLQQLHWDEVVRDDRELEVDWETFFKLESLGKLITLLALEHSDVVGYAVFIVVKHPHSMKTIIAQNDVVFIRKDKRNGGVGYRFLKFCDDELRRSGIDMVTWHIKPATDFSPVVLKLGYHLHETIYAKHLGEKEK